MEKEIKKRIEELEKEIKEGVEKYNQYTEARIQLQNTIFAKNGALVELKNLQSKKD